MGTEQDRGPEESVRSAFWDDEDMRELVEYFVSELDTRIKDMTRAWEQSNAEQIRVFAHQLKGAAPGYGFVGIGAAAGRLESAISALDSSTEISASETEFRALVDLCRRAVVGSAQR